MGFTLFLTITSKPPHSPKKIRNGTIFSGKYTRYMGGPNSLTWTAKHFNVARYSIMLMRICFHQTTLKHSNDFAPCKVVGLVILTRPLQRYWQNPSPLFGRIVFTFPRNTLTQYHIVDMLCRFFAPVLMRCWWIMLWDDICRRRCGMALWDDGW